MKLTMTSLPVSPRVALIELAKCRWTLLPIMSWLIMILTARPPRPASPTLLDSRATLLLTSVWVQLLECSSLTTLINLFPWFPIMGERTRN